ncbi:helix-turn-helix transcriptional regulator [Flavobacterium sp. 3-210]
MKKVIYNYDASLNWLDALGEALGGKIDENFIKVDNAICKGTHFIVPVEDGITAMVVDTTYKEEVLLQYRNENTNYLGLHFYITNLDINLIIDGDHNLIGKLNYNLSFIDCAVDMDYKIQKETRFFGVFIFFKKDILNKYFPHLTPIYDVTLGTKKNTIISLDRMCNESLILIKDFRKIQYDNLLYKIYFVGLVYGLISNFVKYLNKNKIIEHKNITIDVKNIIVSKTMLQNIIQEPFPGINFLAKQVAMSPAKYKKLFARISGANPGTYFCLNKLNMAKELLETGKFTVNEVARKLNYSTPSYLTKRFSEMYGVCPKEYQSLF